MRCYLNGSFVEESDAFISVNSLGFRYGDGFFDTIKFVNGSIALEQLHQKRIASSLVALHFEESNLVSPISIHHAINTLVKQNGLQQRARVRLMVFRGEGVIHSSVSSQPNLLIQVAPLAGERIQLNTEGWTLGTFYDGIKAADAFAGIKSNNYLLYTMASKEAKRNNWDDALVLNQYGRAADTSIANIWAIKHNVLYTPAIKEGPVEGVMRQFLLQLCHEHQINVIVDKLAPAFLYEADGLFLTNAIIGVKWIAQFESKQYDMHPLVQFFAQKIADSEQKVNKK